MTISLPRMTLWLVISIILLVLVWMISPLAIEVVPHKAALVTVGAWLGYWIDRAVAPYARPDKIAEDMRDSGQPTASVLLAVNGAMFRRAAIMAAVIIGMTLGA